MAQIVSLLRHPSLGRAGRRSADWSQQELAEFYRVEAALVQAGMRIESDRGVTDEGDPWFVFCRAEDGETFIHFARIDGEYLIAGPAYEGVAKGWDFPGLVRDLISRHPLVQPTTRRPSNLFMHPAALLIAVVGTAFFKTSEAKAMDDSDHKGDGKRQGGTALLVTTTSAPAVSVHALGSATVAMDANQTLTLIATAMAAQTQRAPIGVAGAMQITALVDGLAVPAPREVRIAKFDPSANAGLPSAGDIGVTGAMAPAVTHHAADGAPGELGAWLALTAVLQDLPGAPAGPSVDSAMSSIVSLLDIAPEPHRVRAAVAFAEVEATVTPQAAPAQPAPPPVVIAVELSPAALPDVAAVRLVRELDGGSHQTMVQVEKLPELLAQVIARGGQLDGEAIDAVTQPPLHNDHAITMPPSGPVDVDVAPDTATEVLPAPVVGAPAPPPHDASVENVIAYFLANTPHVEVLSVQNQVVFYDVRVMDHPEAYAHNIDSVTYNFADGSSVSLVGISQVVHDAQDLH